jgi:D-tyrosyl-tRNA(Tyr) deacylase
MKAVIQRVRKASVSIGGRESSRIGPGFLVLLGVSEGDTREEVERLARKVARLRVLADGDGKMNLSLQDVKGQVLVVSQFTLCADTSRGHRPSFVRAAAPEKAEPLYQEFVGKLKALGVSVETGKFGEYMEIGLVNDGPVTIILEEVAD